jgi:hypothetical protein
MIHEQKADIVVMLTRLVETAGQGTFYIKIIFLLLFLPFKYNANLTSLVSNIILLQLFTVKKKKCEQYWPSKVDDMHQFEHMQMKFLAEGGVEPSDNQEPVKDLIHRRFEVTNLTSGNLL